MKTALGILAAALISIAAFVVIANPSESLSGDPSAYKISEEFKKYWYAGEAELSSYELNQARYGEMRDGSAVLIFVTEDLSKEKQIKLDNPGGNPDDAVSVLKMNQTRKFLTGIYPYSVMQSVFTPVDRELYPHTMKTSFSSQEWCGHVYSQFNLTDRGYDHLLMSYFISEGNKLDDMPLALLEDELFNMIRINPNAIQTGDVKIIPSSTFARFSHREQRPTDAVISIEERGDLMTLVLEYEDINRTLRIDFRKSFPHIIEGWEESSTSGWGASAKIMKTTAVRKSTIKEKYWNLNGNDDEHWRNKLELN